MKKISDTGRRCPEHPDIVAAARQRRKDGARAMMTPKERIKIHIQIERENERKLKEWKERRKAA